MIMRYTQFSVVYLGGDPTLLPPQGESRDGGGLYLLENAMADMQKHKLGWIGIGRMGYAMAERLAQAGCDISVWNRTHSKAKPLAASGAKVVDSLTDLAEQHFLHGRACRDHYEDEVAIGEIGERVDDFRARRRARLGFCRRAGRHPK